MLDRLSAARLLITASAIVVWGYGLQSENATLRVVGMGLLAVALLMRFLKRLPRKDPPASE